MSRAGSDLSAATAVVPAARERRRSVDGSLETYGDESALERLRFFFEDIALSRCVPSFPATLCGQPCHVHSRTLCLAMLCLPPPRPPAHRRRHLHPRQRCQLRRRCRVRRR